MLNRKLLGGFVAFSLVGLVGAAQAQDFADEEPYMTYGASVTLGAGLIGFSDETMRDFTSVGGAWDARLVLGTRTNLGVEAAYTGGAIGIDALGLDSNAALVSTGAEVLARVNILTGEWQPYLVAGMGWRHYSIVNSDRNTSSVGENEDLGEIPMGAGLAYRIDGLVVDARGLYRLAFADELIATSASQDDVSLDGWQGQVTAGYEF